MTSRDFAYWLQGFFEISNQKSISADQVKIIKNHLNLVFKHEIDPSIDNGDKKIQEDLQEIHDGPNPGNQNGEFLPGADFLLRC